MASLNRLWFGSVWGPGFTATARSILSLNRLWFGSVWGLSSLVMWVSCMCLNRLWFGSVWGRGCRSSCRRSAGLNRLWFGSVWGPLARSNFRVVLASQSPLVRLCLGSYCHRAHDLRSLVSIAFGSALFGVAITTTSNPQLSRLNRLWFGSVWGRGPYGNHVVGHVSQSPLVRLCLGSHPPRRSAYRWRSQSPLVRLCLGSRVGIREDADLTSQSPLVRLCLGS